MGNKRSKFMNPWWVRFQEEEVKAIEKAFGINKIDPVALSQDTFIEKWQDYMLETTVNIWIHYIFPQSHLDWNRFTYMHKGQESPFLEEKSQAIIRVLMNISKEQPLSSIQLSTIKRYFKDVMASYLRSLGSFENPDFIKWLTIEATTESVNLNDVVDYFTNELQNKDFPDIVEAKDVEDWLMTKPIVSDILNSLLKIAYGIVDITNSSTVLPTPFSSLPTILDISQILFLCSHMTKSCTKNWRLRFHNQGHGSNYTLLCKMLIGSGPNLMIIKDHGKHVFGCFASDSWKQSSTFYGDCKCFLFQLSPVLRLFEASGFDHHFMYHNVNQHTFPNGFGMGGQIGLFGLWVDADFGHGRCSDFCSTFTDFVRPSVSRDFTFSHIEVWGVSAEENDDDDKNNLFGLPSRLSIMESDPFARAIIEISGKGANSAMN